jgi:hypothetical protein
VDAVGPVVEAFVGDGGIGVPVVVSIGPVVETLGPVVETTGPVV